MNKFNEVIDLEGDSHSLEISEVRGSIHHPNWVVLEEQSLRTSQCARPSRSDGQCFFHGRPRRIRDKKLHRRQRSDPKHMQIRKSAVSPRMCPT